MGQNHYYTMFLAISTFQPCEPGRLERDSSRKRRRLVGPRDAQRVVVDEALIEPLAGPIRSEFGRPRAPEHLREACFGPAGEDRVRQESAEERPHQLEPRRPAERSTRVREGGQEAGVEERR